MVSDLLARAAALVGSIPSPYAIDPSVKLETGTLNAARFMVTFLHPLRLEDVLPRLRELGIPPAAEADLTALFPSAFHVSLGADGQTTRAYLELPNRYRGWKWAPDGTYRVTEYPNWGPPYGGPVPIDAVTASVGQFLAAYPALGSIVVDLLVNAKRSGCDGLSVHGSIEDGVPHGMYMMLPGVVTSYRPTFDALAILLGISPVQSGPVFDAMTGGATLAVGATPGGPYATIYYGHVLAP